ncbi:hypothetical protein DPMN_174115, partial [Dreissena polymorpha]
ILGADIHPACPFSFIEYVGEVLALVTACAYHKVDAISESQVGDRASRDGETGVVVFEGLLHYLLEEQFKQNGKEQTSLTNARLHGACLTRDRIPKAFTERNVRDLTNKSPRTANNT